MTFASQLKSERARLRITQNQAADLLSVPARTYQDWESSVSVPHDVTQEGALNRLKRRKGYTVKPVQYDESDIEEANRIGRAVIRQHARPTRKPSKRKI